ncbi:hypothetical protein SDJN02_12326, partial [Cucurbita argyrosperma subsp. argyrosperma]
MFYGVRSIELCLLVLNPHKMFWRLGVVLVDQHHEDRRYGDFRGLSGRSDKDAESLIVVDFLKLKLGLKL